MKRKNHFRQIIILLLLLVGDEAIADWTKVASGANSVGYADLDTLRKTGNNAALWILVDFEKPPFDGNNLRYLSLKMHNEYDCERAQFRVLSMTSYSEKMARGEQRYKSDEAGEWESISPKTIQKKLWEVACGKRYGIKTNKNLN